MSNENRSAGKLSREEIECLAVVHAVGSGCTVNELAGRLGLSEALEGTLVEGLAPIAGRGWISIDAGVVSPTSEGQSRLADTMRYR